MENLVLSGYISNDKEQIKKEWTLSDIKELLNENHIGMFILSEYQIEGVKYIASGLQFDKSSVPYQKNNKIILPTFFKRYQLCNQVNGDPEDMIKVNVEINPEKIMLTAITKLEKKSG